MFTDSSIDECNNGMDMVMMGVIKLPTCGNW